MVDDHDIEANSDIDLDQDEFLDYSGSLSESALRYDFSQLLSGPSLRAFAAIVVSLLVVQVPDRSPRVLGLLLAVILFAWSFGGLIDLRNEEQRTALNVARAVALLVVAVGITISPSLSAGTLGTMAGVALVVGGLVNGYRVWRHSVPGERLEPLIGAILYVGVGIAVALSPETVFGIALLLVSTYWFFAGVVSIAINIRRDDERQIPPSRTWSEFLEWLQRRPETADDRRQLYEKIFYEGPIAHRRLSRFFTLMGFATAIAAWGIIADSTAVVIGAMLVAPLMTPLMGTSLALIMGWPKRAGISFVVALSGVLLAIGLSIIFGWVYPIEISPELNSQVSSRVGPTLVDLAIAVFAGGAGAFALSRPDVSDSLPGVAVAIALVPPLAVVGLMISQANWNDALGALLLFTTNLVAILLVGALMFVLEGVVPVGQLSRNARWVKVGLGMAGALAIVVIGVLGFSTTTFENEVVGTSRTTETVDAWLAGTDLELVGVEVDQEVVEVTISGSDASPPVEELATGLEESLGRSVGVIIRVVPTKVIEYQVVD